jgi:hypothetical protein
MDKAKNGEMTAEQAEQEFILTAAREKAFAKAKMVYEHLSLELGIEAFDVGQDSTLEDLFQSGDHVDIYAARLQQIFPWLDLSDEDAFSEIQTFEDLVNEIVTQEIQTAEE